MEPQFEKETADLVRSWGRHDREDLRDYLVRDVEDPRINLQSVLTRQFLLARLWPGSLDLLKEHEIRFAVAANWLLGVRKDRALAARHDDILRALLAGPEESPEGVEIPGWVREVFDTLPAEADGLEVPDYLTDALVLPAPSRPDEPPLPEHVASTMLGLFSRALADMPAPAERPAVIEPACGSANDYRYLDAFGIARAIDYRGFDLCEKNIENAREMFPAADFRAGNVLAIEADDRQFEICYFHDLLEHLSIDAMGQAVKQISRVADQSVLGHFFQMHDEPEHLVRTKDDYHWNRLSLAKVVALFEAEGFELVRALHVTDLVTARFPEARTHNEHAWTLHLERTGS